MKLDKSIFTVNCNEAPREIKRKQLEAIMPLLVFDYVNAGRQPKKSRHKTEE
jgi:hypothetical protein